MIMSEKGRSPFLEEIINPIVYDLSNIRTINSARPASHGKGSSRWQQTRLERFQKQVAQLVKNNKIKTTEHIFAEANYRPKTADPKRAPVRLEKQLVQPATPVVDDFKIEDNQFGLLGITLQQQSKVFAKKIKCLQQKVSSCLQTVNQHNAYITEFPWFKRSPKLNRQTKSQSLRVVTKFMPEVQRVASRVRLQSASATHSSKAENVKGTPLNRKYTVLIDQLNQESQNRYLNQRDAKKTLSQMKRLWQQQDQQEPIYYAALKQETLELLRKRFKRQNAKDIVLEACI